jgi:cellulose synthase/poly-beta-1,6-N-acetylglucosamine synthase-like glycosyltransferase
MPSLSGAWLDIWFVASAILIWFMIGYQFALFVAGLVYSRRYARPAATEPAGGWPSVSIVVPARNEARVIAQTICALAALDYPSNRFDITIVDDGSTDETPDIVAAMASADPRIRCFRVPAAEAGGGKARALNRVFPELRHDLIAIYDADNRPERPSLRRLVAEMVHAPRLAAAVGKFRTLNRDRTLLTRFINIEGLAFQWIVQAGRCALLGVTTLPGTNFVIRREVLDEVGGWDPEALTEDAELSIRIYETGRRIRFVPNAVTWEQEPERLGVWFRQRRRWARGHNYVLAKHLRRLLHLRPKRVALELLYTLATYYLVFAAILVSDILFVLGGLGLVSIRALGPYSEIWLLAFALFLLEVTIALSRERGEDSLLNLLLVVAGYFTYCQLWIPVVACAFADDVLRRRRVWVKTERFAEAGGESEP